MTIDYKPDRSKGRDAWYVAKDAASDARRKENGEGGPQARAEPWAHNYLHQGWGHMAEIDRGFDDGRTVEMSGFGSTICPQDFVIMAHPEEGCASYKIDRIRYSRLIPDKWEATATHTPGIFGVTVDGRIVRLGPEGTPVEYL